MQTRQSCVLVLGAAMALGCTPERRAGNAPSSTPAATSAAPAPSVKVATDGCTGREIHDCARTRGCLLDQPTYNKPECRPVENPCEARVRHADLIGSDADPAVTPAMMEAAKTACEATTGCAVTQGRCSCACHVLGNCDCTCGGGYLPRCTTRSERAFYDGRPPAEGGAGPLGVLGNALVKVRRAHGKDRVVIDPLPPIDALVGKPRSEIQGFLGTGFSCTEAEVGKMAPCASTKQVFYSFYKLPAGSVGGGPELLLTYGDKSVCTEARFVHTQ